MKLFLFAILFFGGVLKVFPFTDVKNRWCARNTTVIREKVVRARVNKEVNCLNLYKFIQDGWKYDNLKMKELYGGQGGVASYFQRYSGQTLCHVYLPEQVKRINVTSTKLGCCGGWTGSHCQQRKEELGICYYGNICLNTHLQSSLPEENSQLLNNQRPFSMRACCLLLRGISWQRLPDTRLGKGNCIQCSSMLIKEVKHKAKGKRFCIAWNENSYLNFEGKLMKTLTSCAYRLLTSSDSSWWIDVESQKCTNVKPCTKKIRINFGDDTVVTLMNDNIYFNNEKILVKKTWILKGLAVTKTDGFVTIEIPLGITLQWNWRSIITVVIGDEINISTTRGLCGVLTNKYDTNEWITEEIFQTPLPAVSNQMALRSMASDCRSDLTDDSGCTDWPDERCRFILEDEAFTSCRTIISPDAYYESCLSSLCKTNRSSESIKDPLIELCESAIAYMLVCFADGIEVGSWMQHRKCAWSCPIGKVFTQCTTKCPLSCESLQRDSSSSLCLENCVPGCQCPEGELLKYSEYDVDSDVMNVSVCVRPERCSCKHKDKFYDVGEKILMDCNECLCDVKGSWKCSANHCHGVCHVISASHVVTFDNSRFSFGNVACSRTVLLQSRKAASQFIEIEVEVVKSLEVYSNDLEDIRCLRITIGSSKIKLKRTTKALVNEQEVDLPYRNKDFMIRHSTTHSFMFQTIGLLLIWIPTSDTILISLSPIYADKVMGICGTYNWNPKDDFLTKGGDVEVVTERFVRRFQRNDNGKECISSDGLPFDNLTTITPHPCSTYTQKRHYAERLCNLLRKNTFKICSMFVDSSFYESVCLHDVCISRNASPRSTCKAFSAYALACLQVIEDTDQSRQLLSWRKIDELNGECDLRCPSHLHVSECRPLATTLCADINRPLLNYRNTSLSHEEVRCLPGCACAEEERLTVLEPRAGMNTIYSFFESSMTCVALKQCPCFSRGKLFDAGSEMKTGCISCSCVAGRWSCSSKECGVIVQCPNNMVFRHNVTLCDQKTCENSDQIALMQDRGDCDDDFIYDGCTCPLGKLQQEDKCISPEDCPCQHAGKLFNKNDVISRQCNTCTCGRGEWICTEKPCSGVCVATGDSHYATFDGKYYSFQGKCNYILVRENNALFEVSVENVLCGLSGVTCTKSVYLQAGSTTVHLLRGKRVTVNGAKVGRLPRRYGDSAIGDDTNVLSINLAGRYVVVSWPKIGLSVLWNGGTRVEVQLSPIYFGKVSGLCGNYDKITTNEFTTQQGSVETELRPFVNSWKTSSFCSERNSAQTPFAYNPCEINIHREFWGRRKCSIISRGEVFAGCRDAVQHEIYYDWCVRDACACDSGGDCECVCTAIAAYAQACSQEHVHVRWRSQDLCPMQCDNGMVYEACGPVCQETCMKTEPHCASLPCGEGCFCPSGLLMHAQRCIERSECPCYFDDGEYLPGTALVKNCQNCTCFNGDWICKGDACKPLLEPCQKNEFLCRDGITCISSLWRCDFEKDCIDGSDEVACDWTKSECILMGGHVCGSGKCLSLVQKCNGFHDCEDGSDEEECPEEEDKSDKDSSGCDDFSCLSGKCISEALVCDGKIDCGFGDYSDEKNCYGGCLFLRQFTCGDGNCISRRTYCDGKPDCPDKSDEDECVCTPSYFTCLDGLCIDRVLVCDGEPDCSLGEDENDCVDASSSRMTGLAITNTTSQNCTEFRCKHNIRECIPWSSVCDGQYHCSDESDESSKCGLPCKQDEISCDRGLICVDKYLLCDGNLQCQDGTDESSHICNDSTALPSGDCLSGFRCGNGSCVANSMVCDGKRDCIDGTDESHCSFTSTVGTYTTNIPPLNTTECPGYTCLNGKCISLKEICNGVNDCAVNNEGLMMRNKSRKMHATSDEMGCASWTVWGLWGQCSASCGSGRQVRRRTCESGSDENGHVINENDDPLKGSCRGESTGTKPCYREVCRNETAGLTPWSEWSDCSVTCGGGMTTRWRLCTDGTHTCTVALYGGKFQSPMPLVEIKSCLTEICPDKHCFGDKIYYSCDAKSLDSVEPCPLTCRDVTRGGSTICVAPKIEDDCNPGCHCPRGFVTLNETSNLCLPKEKCPCFYEGKVFDQGEKVRKEATCEICRCSVGGKSRECVDDLTCDQSKLCGWTEWSDWGPCFGPCEASGIQWSFRSSLQPRRYGRGRRCEGVYRKSRRCPTPHCQACDVIDGDENVTSRIVGEQWTQKPCTVCMCLENRTINCRKYCQFSSLGCPSNGTLVNADNDVSCCYCQTSGFRTGSTDNAEAAYSFATPTHISKTKFNENEFDKLRYAHNISTTATSQVVKSGVCDEYQCKDTDTVKCVNREALCDGVADCQDGSDEDEGVCRHFNVTDGMRGCIYLSWSDWSSCTRSCGLGESVRNRGVQRHVTVLNELTSCNGPFQMSRPCFVTACKRDGSWSKWYMWSECSRTCGGGVQSRRRHCDSPAPLNGGVDCNGVCLETKVCNALPCTSDGCTNGKSYVSGSECSMLEICAQTCEDLSEDVKCQSSCQVSTKSGECFCPKGTYLQDDKCVPPRQCRCTVKHNKYKPGSTLTINGCECQCVNGTLQCSSSCSKECKWSLWSKWSQCDRTCGYQGRMHRYRSPVILDHPHSDQVVNCNGVPKDSKMCPYKACSPTWTGWSPWSQCSSSCGIGKQYRKRECSIDGEIAEKCFCKGSDQTFSVMQYRICKNPRNDSLCSSCSGNMKYQCVKCAPSCEDISTSIQLCTNECVWMCTCPSNQYKQNSACVPVSECSCDFSFSLFPSNHRLLPGHSKNIGCNTCTCVMGKLVCSDNVCPDTTNTLFKWSPWSRWTECSRTCVDDSFPNLIGTRSRYRKCLRKRYEQKGKARSTKRQCDGESEQAVQCGLEVCGVSSSAWSSWSPWSSCDRSCGGGTQMCTRICNNKLGREANTCNGPTYKIRCCLQPPCEEQQCPPGSSFKEGCRNHCSKQTSCYQLSSEVGTDEDCKISEKTVGINCTGGFCQCDSGLLWQEGSCITGSQCNCYAMGQVRRSGANFTVGSCTACTCKGGKVTCFPRTHENGSFFCDPDQSCYDADDGDVTWSTWTSCSKSCDVGVRRRFSKPKSGTDDLYIGAWCRHRASEQEDCNELPCSDVNCNESDGCNSTSNGVSNGWSAWSLWGSCSSTCSMNNTTSWCHRYRKCYTSSWENCVGPETQSSPCNDSLIPSCDDHTSWSEWSHWSECAMNCSSIMWSNAAAYRMRTRTCDGGGKCKGEFSQAKSCIKTKAFCQNSSPPTPKDDEECQSHVSGSRFRECGPQCTRTCFGTMFCVIGCKPSCFCPAGLLFDGNTSCIHSSLCKCYDEKTKQHFHSGESFTRTKLCKQMCQCGKGVIQCQTCPRQPSRNSWSHWTSCTRTCGVQNRYRLRSRSANKTLMDTQTRKERTISEDVVPGFNKEYYIIETEPCKNAFTCYNNVERQSSWGQWGAWTDCSCISPFAVRKRACFRDTHSKYGLLRGEQCPGISFQTRPCKVNFSKCGRTCQGGLTLSLCSTNLCPRSCMDLSVSVGCVENDNVIKKGSCTPQCSCPPGLLINPDQHGRGFECVLPHQCSCFVPSYVNSSSDKDIAHVSLHMQYTEDCRNCTCQPNGRLECGFTKTLACKTANNKREWSIWSSWSDCSVTCQGGKQWRLKLCNPQLDESCHGTIKEDRSCNEDLSCSMTPWRAWGSCSNSCGQGIRSRWRYCLPEQRCKEEDRKEFVKCNQSCSSFLTQWSSWSPCSASCDVGTKVRQRWCKNAMHDLPIFYCTKQASLRNDGLSYVNESRNCHGKLCSKLLSDVTSWSAWSQWSDCIGACGNGTQTKKRHCTSLYSQEHASRTCLGENVIYRSCELATCPSATSLSPCPAGMLLGSTCDDCIVGDRSLAGRLPQTCRELASELIRLCDSESCAQVCLCEHGKLVQLHGSALGICVVANECECQDEAGTVWPAGSQWNTSRQDANQTCRLTCSCSIGRIVCRDEDCVSRDRCEWTQWEGWSECDGTCLEAKRKVRRFRFRSSNVHATAQESECDDGGLQIDSCEGLPKCPDPCSDEDYKRKLWWEDACTRCSCDGNRHVICNNTCWSEWSLWSSCSSTCGNELYQSRKRSCLSSRFCADAHIFVQERQCSDVKATSYIPCPNEEATMVNDHFPALEDFGLCSQEDCPGLACRSDEKMVKEPGNCCVTCQPDKGSHPVCSIHTEKRVFSSDGCKSGDTEIRFCVGSCQSSTRVLPQEPYIESSCNCCTYNLNEVSPTFSVVLYCLDQSQSIINIPNIVSCSCSLCNASKKPNAILP